VNPSDFCPDATFDRFSSPTKCASANEKDIRRITGVKFLCGCFAALRRTLDLLPEFQQGLLHAFAGEPSRVIEGFSSFF